jgi:hypothetical protein
MGYLQRIKNKQLWKQTTSVSTLEQTKDAVGAI